MIITLKRLRWAFFVLALLLIFAIGGFAVWAGTPAASAMPQALAALNSDSRVTVTVADDLLFRPTGGDARVGYIFYPGGRVQPEAYAPMARAIAEAGYLVVIVRAPLDLAFFDVGAAGRVMDVHPQVSHWVVGGHSLGGVAAASFAKANPDRVDGLALLASYPAPFDDLSQMPFEAVSIYGSRDGLADEASIRESIARLPIGARLVRIEGGNHAYFGWYGPQAGDNEALITREEQMAQVVSATLQLLAAVTP